METRACKKCGVTHPLPPHYFGHQPNGSLRYACRDCVKKNTRRHQIEKPLQELLRRQDRQDRMSEYGSKVSQHMADQVFDEAKGRCFYCDVPNFTGHVDHMTPVVQGGSNDRGNLVYACVECNQAKHAKKGIEFYAYRQRLGLPISEQYERWSNDDSTD